MSGGVDGARREWCSRVPSSPSPRREYRRNFVSARGLFTHISRGLVFVPHFRAERRAVPPVRLSVILLLSRELVVRVWVCCARSAPASVCWQFVFIAIRSPSRLRRQWSLFCCLFFGGHKVSSGLRVKLSIFRIAWECVLIVRFAACFL